ncbi:hypothetical protein CALVIDRAFT_170241 [Calocera viscosa TUFC12733]|uniref:Uncharacterized protein n=1 Tax=Calocera viscosa (strain TUFC12733) TaxID=1330018 RepID=A0A167L6W5_CALVF|nr:hypothetical protein CALVIDRAFT_170241 [Calocera viscosa TUFC12733]
MKMRRNEAPSIRPLQTLLATRRMLYATRQRCPCARKEEGGRVPWPPHALHVIVITVLSKLAGSVAVPISHSRVATMMSVGPMMSILRSGVWLRGKVAGVKPSLVERPLRSATFGHASCARNRYHGPPLSSGSRRDAKQQPAIPWSANKPRRTRPSASDRRAPAGLLKDRWVLRTQATAAVKHSIGKQSCIARRRIHPA